MRIIIVLFCVALAGCSTIKEVTVLSMKSGNCVHNFATSDFKRVYCDLDIEQLPTEITETYRIAYLVMFPGGRKMYVLDAYDPAIKAGSTVHVDTKPPVRIVKTED